MKRSVVFYIIKTVFLVHNYLFEQGKIQLIANVSVLHPSAFFLFELIDSFKSRIFIYCDGNRLSISI